MKPFEVTNHEGNIFYQTRTIIPRHVLRYWWTRRHSGLIPAIIK